MSKNPGLVLDALWPWLQEREERPDVLLTTIAVIDGSASVDLNCDPVVQLVTALNQLLSMTQAQRVQIARLLNWRRHQYRRSGVWRTGKPVAKVLASDFSVASPPITPSTLSADTPCEIELASRDRAESSRESTPFISCDKARGVATQQQSAVLSREALISTWRQDQQESHPQVHDAQQEHGEYSEDVERNRPKKLSSLRRSARLAALENHHPVARAVIHGRVGKRKEIMTSSMLAGRNVRNFTPIPLVNHLNKNSD